MKNSIRFLGLGILLSLAGAAVAQSPFGETAREVNKKLVKVYGSGGFRGLPEYGTGILISPNGYILTVNNHILAVSVNLRVHLADGRYYDARILAKTLWLVLTGQGLAPD